MKVEDLDIGSEYLVGDDVGIYTGTETVHSCTVYRFDMIDEEYDLLLTEEGVVTEVSTVPEPDECYCGHCYYCCGVSRSDFL